MPYLRIAWWRTCQEPSRKALPTHVTKASHLAHTYLRTRHACDTHSIYVFMYNTTRVHYTHTYMRLVYDTIAARVVILSRKLENSKTVDLYRGVHYEVGSFFFFFQRTLYTRYSFFYIFLSFTAYTAISLARRRRRRTGYPEGGAVPRPGKGPPVRSRVCIHASACVYARGASVCATLRSIASHRVMSVRLT